MSFPSVTAIILNWNGRKFLEKFLPSVLSTQYPNFKILLADNGSTDDSIDFVEKNYPSIQILKLEKNHGFTTGNNLALEHVTTPYFVLLNSDVEVTPNWLGPLVELMEKDDKIAAVQPKLLAYHAKDTFEYAGGAGGYIDKWGYPFCRGRLFDIAEKDRMQYEGNEEIFWATGACSLIRKSVTDQIGLFEDEFFAHMEEIDFCWRAKNYGWKVYYCSSSQVYHVGGGTLHKSNPRKTFLNARNSMVVLIKNLPKRKILKGVLVRAFLDGVWAFRELTRGKVSVVWAIFKAHWAVWLKLGHWLKRRKATYPAGMEVNSIPGKGFYPRSIVWHHFAKGVKTFLLLPK